MVDTTAHIALGAAPPRAPKGRRLVAVDAVRALALLGVLFMNFRDMSGLDFLSAEALARLQGPLDRAADLAFMVLVDGKSLSAFSFLFGLSFTLLLDRARARGGPFLPFYARRLAALAAFGVVNFTFFFWGDILITYAALGGLLLLAVRLPQRAVLAVSAALLLGVPAVLALTGTTRGPDVQTAADLKALAAFGGPSYTASAKHAVERFFGIAGSLSGTRDWHYANIFGLFLLGLWAGRRRIPHEIGKNRDLLLRTVAVGLPLGLAASAAGALLAPTSPLSTLMLAGTPVLAVAYLAAAALALDAPAGRRARDLLAPVGRMALTNYLASGLIGQAVFHGWGLGLIGTVGTAGVLAVALAAYGLLIAASHAWFAAFRMGPAEWLWRTLTHMRPQPLRREVRAAAGPKVG